MTEKEYRSHPAISRSELLKIRESPQKFRYYKDNPEEPTPTLLFGQLFHKMLLEPQTVWDEFAIAPNFDRRTKAGKDAWIEFCEKNGEKILVTADMAKQAELMCDSVLSEPLAKKLLAGEHEKPFFWTDELTGEQCKCRADVFNTAFSKPIVVDVKSTADASNDGFMHSAVKYGYDFQSAFYTEGISKNIGEKPLFVFIAVEKDPPFAVNILQADEIFMRRGYDLFREYIGIFHDCKQTGNWYGYLGKLNQINNLALPSWLAKEVE